MDTDTVSKFEEFVNKFSYKSATVEGSGQQEAREKLITKCQVFRGSVGERLVKRILDDDLKLRHGIDYFTEHVFEDMGRRLRFDFYIKKYYVLIEFDGDQHYSGSKFHRTRAEWIDAIQRDEIKNRYCEDNKYSLLRVPQMYAKYPDKLRQLIIGFIDRVDREGFVMDVDLYFRIKAGKQSL